MDKYGIDGHKLIYHVSRVTQWLENGDIYPIYMEIGPAGICNHRCVFCALDFMGYRHRFLDAGVLKERLQEMGALGIKGIMYGGEGEPLLHRDISEIIRSTSDCSIDTAVTSNGVLFNGDIAEAVLPYLQWIKISINAGTKESYSKIHRTKPGDFDTVIENIELAVRIKQKNRYKCTIGVQMLLLPENRAEAEGFAQRIKDTGADYLVIKPYSQHPKSKTNTYEDISYSTHKELSEKLADTADERFNIIFRTNAMKRWDEKKRNYDRCLAHPFWSYMDAGGNVWGCSIYLIDERFLYGNIYINTFKEIWESDRRSEIKRWIENEFDTGACRINCRMDTVNEYLWKLKNPPEHVNFI